MHHPYDPKIMIEITNLAVINFLNSSFDIEFLLFSLREDIIS